MGWERRMAEAKATELAQMVATTCTDMGEPMDEKTASEIVDNFVKITPPPDAMEMIVTRPGGRDGGVKRESGQYSARYAQPHHARGGGSSHCYKYASGAMDSDIGGARHLEFPVCASNSPGVRERCVRYVDAVAAERCQRHCPERGTPPSGQQRT